MVNGDEAHMRTASMFTMRRTRADRRVEAPRSSGSRTRENKELMQRVAKLKGPKPEEWAAR